MKNSTSEADSRESQQYVVACGTGRSDTAPAAHDLTCAAFAALFDEPRRGKLTILEEIKRGWLKSFRIGPAEGRAPHRISAEEVKRYERDNTRGVDPRIRLTPRQKAGGAA